MKTAIDLSEASTATNPLNAISRNKRQSIDAQNRMRVQKKRIIDEMSQNSSNERTNNENLDHNVIVRDPTVRPSIGKWMYESDDYLNETPIDLSTSAKEDTNSAADDDIEVIGTYSAGPSGLSQRPTKESSNTVDDNDLTIILDCDLNPNLLTTGLNLSLFDMNMDAIDDQNVQTEQEVITIDDNNNDEPETSAPTVKRSRRSVQDFEIIRVKLINPPQTDNDSEIEMLSEMLSPEEVIDMMRNYLVEIQNTTLLSFTTLRLLMSKFNWDIQQFTFNYYEVFKGNINHILKAYKIEISHELKQNTKRRKTRRTESTTSGSADNAKEQKTCQVCFDETDVSLMFAAMCQHYLCIDCWNQYISTHVNDRSSNDWICCPGDNCHITIEDAELLSIINDQSVADRYRRLISNSYVKNNKLLRWCPNGDCLHAIRVKNDGPQDIECVCKTVFCYLCGDQWHEPLTCAQYKNWIQKYSQETIDKKSATWLTKNTKMCPKCQFPIEKNGGCNYVACLKCRHQFCYNCLGKCAHGRCLGQNAADAQEAQAMDYWVKNHNLTIYPTIKNQYQKQLNQYSIEANLQKNVSKKLEEVVKCPEFRTALKFIKSAFTVLCHCRQTLIYSYVFGYYLIGPPETKSIYLTNLQLLEKQTESLSKVLTSQNTAVIQKDEVGRIRRQVQPIYRECEAKRSRLVSQIREGLDQNLWQFVNAFK